MATRGHGRMKRRKLSPERAWRRWLPVRVGPVTERIFRNIVMPPIIIETLSRKVEQLKDDLLHDLNSFPWTAA